VVETEFLTWAKQGRIVPDSDQDVGEDGEYVGVSPSEHVCSLHRQNCPGRYDTERGTHQYALQTLAKYAGAALTEVAV
jgi:hypothetical protein